MLRLFGVILNRVNAATPPANDHDTTRGAAADARPALDGKRYIARTDRTKPVDMAPIWISEVSPSGKIPAASNNRAATSSKNLKLPEAPNAPIAA